MDRGNPSVNERKRPTLLRIIDSDYTAAMAILLPIVFWFFFWLLSVMHVVDLQILRYVVIGLTIILLALLAWRCWLITRIFAEGVEKQADVQQVTFSRERGRLLVSFIWEGRPLQKNSLIPKNNYTQTIQEGQQIAIMVDRDDPRRAFVRDLYLLK
jgi:hypothetical protein